LALADAIEASPLLNSVRVGDALFVNQRLDAFTLLAAIVGRTERVLLGPACMGSFALREPRVFAYEWASLDVLSNGRTRLAVCSGGSAGPAWDAETEAMGFPPVERRRRMSENIHALRHLWTRDEQPFEGKFIRFSGVAVSNLAHDECRQAVKSADGHGRHRVRARPRRAHRRRLDDAFGQSGRFSALMGLHRAHRHSKRPRHGGVRQWLCHHVNIAENSDTALADAKRFLDLYYGANYSHERLAASLAYGPPQQVIAQLRRYLGSGCNRITLRLATMGDATTQFRRLTEEVLPFVNSDRVASAAAEGVR
jgi:alkanesulfonate monooxygenase SsuD/methylene tetrahydromethanopterin reductase-like flavin-dependent oxidoreductase (luciferase family)